MQEHTARRARETSRKNPGYGETIFPVASTAEEADRLDSQTEVLDQFTTQTLTEIGIREGLRCLEVGAGTGSIALWMSRLGADVTALDRDLRFLDYIGTDNYVTWLAGDITHDEQDPAFKPGFDIIHARLVVAWTHNRPDVITRLAAWLNPGGRLVIGDPVLPPNMANPIYKKTMDRCFNLIEKVSGADFSWGWRLPAEMNTAGLRDIGCRVEFPPIYGGNAWAQSHIKSLRLVVETAVVDAVAAPERIQEHEVNSFNAYLSNPSTADLGVGIYYAWGAA